MRSNALSAALFVATVMLCSCASMVEKLREHNDRMEARQEAQRLANENANQGSDDVELNETTTKPTIERHAPYKGKVNVALFVTFRGELWQGGMQSRAADILRRDLAAHAQFDLIPDARMQELGKLEQPRLGSSIWVGRVRDHFGKDGPQVLLHVTLTSEEAIGKNKKSGKVEKYPKFTAQTSYRHITRNASATYSKDGHVFANGNVMNDVIAEFHNRTLTEIMPAK